MKLFIRRFLCIIFAGCFIFTVTACKDKKTQEEDMGNIVENIDELTIAETNYDLIKNGVSDYEILLPTDASPSEKTAAAELTEIFYNSSGYTLNTVTAIQSNGIYISIGNTPLYDESGLAMDASVLGNGGFIINRIGRNIVINATTESGKIYGVYTFCEKNLDYMYFFADEIRYVKNTDRKLLDFDITVVPSFDGRNVFSYDTHLDFKNAMRLRVNESINKDWPSNYGEGTMWSILNDQSIVQQIVPVKKYYDDHPEWFYLPDSMKGQDFSSMTDSEANAIAKENMQLCYTEGYYEDGEGSLFQTFVNNLIENYIAKEPEKTLFMIGMADNSRSCQCDRCLEDASKYKNSGVMMRFMNKVASAVDQWIKNESGTPNRKIYLVTFAYYKYMEPPVILKDSKWVPTDESVIANESICIRIAPLTDANYYWPLNDKLHNSALANYLAGWKEIANNFAIWDYRIFYNDCVVQYPYWNVIKRNLELYKDMNVIDVLCQGIYQTSGIPFSRLDDYVRARLMFNLNADIEKLTNNFIDAYYKDAAPFIREYIDFLRMHYETFIIPQSFTAGIYSTIMTSKYWPLETLQAMKRIFDQAYESIKHHDKETYELLKSRIDVESRFYRYAEIELYGSLFSSDELGKAIDDFEEANKINPLIQHAVRVDINEKIAEWRSRIK